jgi:hypothetical protein
MRFLSDSLLEGRAPDSRGYQIAARYVATELESMGLSLGGLNSKWLQPVPLRKAVLDTRRAPWSWLLAAQWSISKSKVTSKRQLFFRGVSPMPSG